MSGLGLMLASCVAFAGMGTFVYAGQIAEPGTSALVSSFLRIVINLVFVVATALVVHRIPRAAWVDLRGDGRFSLWLRGVFGACALMTGFASIKAIGVGEATFLHSSSSIFIAFMAPFVLKQRNSARAWIAILGATIGLYLLSEPRLADAAPWGRAVAIASGFFAACAHLMIARAGKTNSPASVVFHFCVVGTVAHLALFATLDIVWPREPATYALLFVAGLSGSIGQIFLTRAYQSSPAALNAAISYLTPVLNLAASVAFFDRHPDLHAWIGSAVVLAFGVMLPFLRRKPRALARVTQ